MYALPLRAIEKSNQLWTSYTIHRQNLLAHCFALKRLSDEDEARNLYKIATEEKIALLKLIQTKVEENHMRMQKEWNDWQQLYKNAREKEDFLDLISSRGTAQVHALEVLLSQAHDRNEEEDFVRKTQMAQSLLSLSGTASELIQKTNEELAKTVSDAMSEHTSRQKIIVSRQNKLFGKQIASLASIEQDLSMTLERNQKTLSATYGEQLTLLHTAQDEAKQISTSLVKADNQLQGILDLHASRIKALVEEVLNAQKIMNAASVALNETVKFRSESNIESNGLDPILMRLMSRSVNLDTRLKKLNSRYRQGKCKHRNRK